MRTVADFIDLMRHGLGKIPAPGHDLYATLNDAGRSLITAPEAPPHNHTWSWTKNAAAPLSIQAGVSEVELPRDFGQVSTVVFKERSNNSIVLVDAVRMSEIRQSNTTPTGVVYLCFDVGPANVSRSGYPAKMASVWPVQSSALSDVIMTYTRTWREVKVEDNNATPGIPAEYERLLTLIARDFAICLENQLPTIEGPAAVQELARLVAFDAGRQVKKGGNKYSVMAAAGGPMYANRPHGRISR